MQDPISINFPMLGEALKDNFCNLRVFLSDISIYNSVVVSN